MRHVRLGRTGLSVSRLCLGTMTFGLQCDEPTSIGILDRAAAGGITFLDTSDVYPLGGSLQTVGRTEEILGRWLATRRHDFVIATKCFGATSARPWDRGNSRKHILDAIEGSLRRLRTDYVDLYQLHHPDPHTPIEESLRALDDIVRDGQGPLHRLLQLPRLSGGTRPREERDARAGLVRLRAAALQPAVPTDRARAAAALPGGRHRRDSVQPARGRLSLRQASGGGRAHGGNPLHPGQCGPALPGAILARARVRHRRRPPPARRRGRCLSDADGRGVGPGASGRSPRPSSAPAGRISSTRCSWPSTRSCHPVSRRAWTS